MTHELYTKVYLIFYQPLNECTDRPASVTTPNSMPPLPPLVPTTSDQLHSMQKYYEDTMKRYMNDLQASSHNPVNSSNSATDASPGLGDSNVSIFLFLYWVPGWYSFT